MTQRIHLAAILEREGKLLLVRPQIGARWELPGRAFGDDADDMDAAIAAELLMLGVTAPNIEEDFFETVFLGEPEDRLVYNIYAPAGWGGEPAAAVGADVGWFAIEALASLQMDEPIRNAILQAFGLQERPDTAAQIAEALKSAAEEAPGPAIPSTTAVESASVPPGGATPDDGERAAESPERIEQGRDVLNTLNAGDPMAEANLRANYGELADDILGVLGDTWARPVIDRKTRSLQVVAMLAALGKAGALRAHLAGALNHGASPEQLIETMRTVAVYAGFPAALAGWTVMEEVFAARGIQRDRGDE